ncbi:hypothetical protein WN48_01725 [Eufriesea mexicana]|nr:hypothetical protein WN48_01725 [Eufriesea mexicana]
MIYVPAISRVRGSSIDVRERIGEFSGENFDNYRYCKSSNTLLIVQAIELYVR